MKLKFSIDEAMAFLEIQWMEGNAVRETEGFGAMWSTKKATQLLLPRHK